MLKQSVHLQVQVLKTVSLICLITESRSRFMLIKRILCSTDQNVPTLLSIVQKV